MALLVEQAPVAGVEPAVGQGRRRLFGLVPVAGHDGVRPGQHLALGVDGDLGADGRRPGPHQLAGPLVGGQVVPLGSGAG